MDLLQRFEEAGHDGHDLRPVVLWSWNDRLDPEEVRRQVREMAKAGLAGHFMRARRGCETPYLGPEWMEAVLAAVDEARHTGVASWLYDEDLSPVGAGPGRTPASSEPLQAKHLEYEEIEPRTWEPTERTVAVFLARRHRTTHYRDLALLDDPRRACGMALGAGRVLVAFTYRTEAGVDTLSRDAAEEFLKASGEVYRQAVGGQFGRQVPGVFVATPAPNRPGHRVPWSLELPRFFRRSAGYDLAGHLPELFFPVGPYRRTRFDFYESVARLLLLAWTMPMYQWCERHGLQLTGRLMGEETLLGQVGHVGAVMPHYEYMHIPRVDLAGRRPAGPVVVKQAASVAAQLGRPAVLGEMFAGAGWDLRLDDLRFLAEGSFALGVTRLCPHHAAFSLRGERKRDFPPSLHSHQPWWPHYCLWNDYAARLLAALTAGEAVADVLVIHPVASAWAEYSPLGHAPLDRLDAALQALAETLLGMHADFHFGDELMLERHGSVRNGEVLVGSRRYKAVVVPDATNLRASTVLLLERFRRSGGRVVFAGRVPGHVDGEPSPGPARLARRASRADPSTRAGRRALRRLLGTPLQVLSPGGADAAAIRTQWRRDGRDQIFFFLNVAARPVKTVLRLPGTGRLLRLDPETGRAAPVEAKARGGRTTLAHTFGPRQGLLLLLRAAAGRPSGRGRQVAGEDRGAAAAAPLSSFAARIGPDAGVAPEPRRRKVLAGRWRVRRRDPNVLVLDVACWRRDDGPYFPPLHVLDIQQALVRNGSDELVCLKFQFDCGIRDLKGRRFELVLEQPRAWEFWYGGMRTPLVDGGPYWDPAFRRVDVTPFVRRGRNVLELKRPWHVEPSRRGAVAGVVARQEGRRDSPRRAAGGEPRTGTPNTELEAVYLVGDFGVAFPRGTSRGRRVPARREWMRGVPRLVDEPLATTGRDLVRAGYPFFAGRLALTKDVVLREAPSPGARLELSPPAAVTATVEINGQEAGTVWKAPWTVPAGEFLVRGTNRIAVTLTTGLRNLLGPHRWGGPGPDLVTADAFAGATPASGGVPPDGAGRAANRRYRADYNVVDFGLGGAAVLRY